jgi:hypothetical protein
MWTGFVICLCTALAEGPEDPRILFDVAGFGLESTIDKREKKEQGALANTTQPTCRVVTPIIQ